ncbi:MBL fold metallo-hydrolase [Desulfobacter curvatus]|uniref:MBL fold metallo-hydrolase n=1 Tax=Desulfobacter curvatus TaxID=2290 RepID=UPI0003630A59|nr:MBL fold metallo-hydrolase [Desulfobacter curvatus]
MKITCLLENNTTDPQLAPDHGLSFFIRTRDRSILFDMGQDSKFADNARHLGVDLTKTDLSVLSHGHYDHGGGLPYFQKINSTAETIMTQKAFDEKYYAQYLNYDPKYIGLDTDAIDQSRCRFIDSDLALSEDLTIITDFSKKGFIPKNNAGLFRQNKDGQLVDDEFTHELALLIEEAGTTVLFTGCAHSGMGNMIDTVLTRTGRNHIDHVIGGFHLYNRVTRVTEADSRLDILVNELSSYAGTTYYTGHCTGPDAPAYMSQKMGRPIHVFATGTRLEI